MIRSNFISFSDIINATQGELIFGREEQSIALHLNTDTRKIQSGDLFVALRGENFDAHDFLLQAAQKGASLILCETNPISENPEWPEQTSVIRVQDSLIALQQLAAFWRKQLTDRAIGITGSNGKTSTKDLTLSVLSQRFKTQANLGNLNNHIGLPLTVLSNTLKTEASIYEMGMNHSGEIAPLCEICQPKVGIITSIGTAHIEHMGTQRAIAEEKGALARSLPSYGTLIIPDDLSYRELVESMTSARIVTISLEGRGDLNASEIKPAGNRTQFTLHLPSGDSATVILPLKGRHMVSNALLAAAAGHQYGMSAAEISRGLSHSTLTSGRLRQFSHSGHTILDDTYNANPDSVKAAARTLAESLNEGQSGYIILGKMAEIGATSAEAHFEVGAYAANLGLNIITVGTEADKIAEGGINAPLSRHFRTKEDATQWLGDNLHKESVLLFKGSRVAAMETLMNTLFPETKTQN